MKTIKLLVVSAFLLGISSCQKEEAAKKETQETSTKAIGKQVDMAKAITLAGFESKVEGKDMLEDVTLKAKVKDVCQMKGCWMTLEKEDGSTMMVKFKDYGFFVPKDIAGKEVVMHGIAKKELIPVEELRHYAEDAGKTQEEILAITEPESKINFEADGVVITY